ncbi:MAG TPA: hypothetical protein VF188_03125 [Longimicrobiales bacterium]
MMRGTSCGLWSHRGAARGGVALLLLSLVGSACRGQERPATEFAAEVDSLLPRLERLSGLEAREPVRVEWQDSAGVRAYIQRQLDDELPPEDLAGMHATYAAFGLIPDSLDLRRLLLDLYTEQVAGYYDPDTETLYLVEGAAPQELGVVLAHELVHALQDQHANLDSLIARERGNDRQTAAQAAIEGQATLVMVALAMEERIGVEVAAAQLPDIGAQLEPMLETQNAQFPVFRSAPRIIRETLLFPYARGAAFVQALWRAAEAEGETRRPAPLGPLLPQSTEQVIRPRERFIGERDAPTELRLAEPAADWRAVYENTLGELETGILLEEHLGAGADSLAIGWDGDRYRLLEAPDGGSALVWYTVWDSDAAADAFAEAYQRILEARPDRRGRVERIEIEGRPGVRVIDAERGVPLDRVPVPAVTGVVEG